MDSIENVLHLMCSHVVEIIFTALVVIVAFSTPGQPSRLSHAASGLGPLTPPWLVVAQGPGSFLLQVMLKSAQQDLGEAEVVTEEEDPGGPQIDLWFLVDTISPPTGLCPRASLVDNLDFFPHAMVYLGTLESLGLFHGGLCHTQSLCLSPLATDPPGICPKVGEEGEGTKL